ncbi:four helix bundle protein [Flagellimonas myxillae]|uniref:four helix bundle protein n=1 Tax=Flagellimonas myxillae TaxID=2942214 RepID=UPI00201F293F|nr:four helix bundle protein [Muricauda myxillae]MCL6266012.1 four helix bundle protein [Muricauda myxillae]
MQDLKLRTKTFAVNCWELCTKLPKTREFSNYVNQLLRSSSSVGANYRASQRAKSTADFINKLKIVEEEADESAYWLELFLQISDSNHEEIKELHKEAQEILAIIVASIKTTRKNQISK